jgi:hypothetical protein
VALSTEGFDRSVPLPPGSDSQIWRQGTPTVRTVISGVIVCQTPGIVPSRGGPMLALPAGSFRAAELETALAADTSSDQRLKAS